MAASWSSGVGPPRRRASVRQRAGRRRGAVKRRHRRCADQDAVRRAQARVALEQTPLTGTPRREDAPPPVLAQTWASVLMGAVLTKTRASVAATQLGDTQTENDRAGAALGPGPIGRSVLAETALYGCHAAQKNGCALKPLSCKQYSENCSRDLPRRYSRCPAPHGEDVSRATVCAVRRRRSAGHGGPGFAPYAGHRHD
jgi:hypothetical protein